MAFATSWLRDVGALAATAGTTAVVDACVTEGALRRRDVVITADAEDLEALAAAADRHLEAGRRGGGKA